METKLSVFTMNQDASWSELNLVFGLEDWNRGVN